MVNLRNFILILFSFFTTVCYSAPTIRFGVVSYYPPYVFDRGAYSAGGLDFEIAEAICTELKANCSYVQLPLSTLLSQLNQNKLDAILGAIAITPEKKNLFNFSIPYLKTTASVIANNKSIITLTPEGLKGRKIGIMKDSNFFTYAYSHFPGTTLISFDSAEQLITALTSGKIDLALLDTPAADYWVTYNQGQLIKVGGLFNVPNEEGFGIVTKKNNTALTQQLNAAIKTIIKNKRLENILHSYIARSK